MKFRKPDPTGKLMAFGPVLLLFFMIGGMIGAARLGHPPGVNVVDHQYDPVVAAEMNKDNCTTHAPRDDGAMVGVNCQTAWRPSFDYSLPR